MELYCTVGAISSIRLKRQMQERPLRPSAGGGAAVSRSVRPKSYRPYCRFCPLRRKKAAATNTSVSPIETT